MKLYSHVVSNVVLIAALAVPAFCQKPSPFPEPKASADVMDSLATQVTDLADQAARMAMDAKTLAVEKAISSDQVDALTKQAAVLAGQFDSDKLSVLIDKAAIADQFSFDNNFDLKMSLSQDNLNDMKAAAMDFANQAKMAFLQAPTPPTPPVAPRGPKAMIVSPFRGRDDGYGAGTRALDEHKYDEAVQAFDNAITRDPSRAEGALYWKAFALNREGKRDEALAAIAQLRRDYASSAWLHDAQALEAEVKQGNGQPVSPAQESNDDLKLLAINSLMNADAERALPLVENILKGNSGPSVKDRALFVISQNKSPRAQQALLDYAKGGGNPDLQLRAIQYVGMSGTKEAQQQLVSIYSSSSDPRVKASILQSLMQAHASDALMNIAKSEKDTNLRGTAIRVLALTKGVSAEGLVELYSSADAVSKREIINGLMARGDGKTLVDLSRKETDPATKKMIVERLSNMRDNKDALDYMMELLK
jgi:tetratricopeptide (TPR) repeat protein